MNRTDARLAVTAIILMHTTVYVTHILFTQSRAECTLGLKEGGLAKKHSLRSLAFLAKYVFCVSPREPWPKFVAQLPPSLSRLLKEALQPLYATVFSCPLFITPEHIYVPNTRPRVESFKLPRNARCNP